MKRLLLVFGLLASWTMVSAQTYCTTGLYTTGCSVGDDLDGITLGSYSQSSSGCSTGGYGDFTSDTISVVQSQTPYPFTASTTYAFGNEYFGVWIDWNDDGDFTDANEFMDYSPTSHGAGTPWSTTLLIDNTLPAGYHRMRVRVIYGSVVTSANSCSSHTWGEVHDYTLNVLPDVVGGCANQFSNFVLDSILDVSAKATWTPGTGNSSWYLEYGVTGFTPGTGTKLTGTYPANQPPAYLTSLTANTSYDIYFGEICNSGADTARFGNPQSFTTAVSCPVPTGLTASATSPTAGTASWSAILANSYEVLYGAAGFDPATAGSSIVTSNSNTAITPLTANTAYDVYVISNCGAGGYSDTVGPVSFRTPCTIFSAPFNENFDSTSSWFASGSNSNNTIDPCWTSSPDVSQGSEPFKWIPRGSGPSSGNGPLQDLTGGNFMYVEASSSSSGDTAFLTTPPIDVSNLTTPGLYFFQHRYSGGTIADMEVLVSGDFGSSWSSEYSVTGDIQTSSSDPWVLEFVNLAAYAGDTIMVRFKQKGNGCCGDAAIDSVVVDEAPTCPWPTGAAVVSVTDSSAVVSWNDPTGSAWELKWGPPGFTQASPGAGTANTTNNPDTITGLQSNTDYEYYVRTDCGPNGSSIWIGPIGFSTECSPFIAPYSNNFDSNPTGEAPNCWKDYKKGGSPQFASVVVQSTTNSYSSPNALYIYNYNTDTTMAISPNFGDMDAGDKQVRFKAYSSSTGAQIIVGTLSSATGNTFTPIDTITLANTYNEYIVKLNAANGYNGTDNYVGLMHGNVGTFTNMYVDDFNYEAIPSCTPPLSSSLGAFKVSPTSELVYWSSGGGDSTIVEVGGPGFTPGTGTYNFLGGAVDTFALATGLTPQTNYCFYVKDTCFGIGASAWVGPFCFETPCLAQSMPYTETFDTWRPSCWDTVGGTRFWAPFAGTAGDNYAEANFWGWTSGNYSILTSPLVTISQDAVVKIDWSHRYSASYPNDELILRAQVAGTGVWDTILQLKGPNNFDDPTAGSSNSPGTFITEDVLLDPAVYTGNDVIVEVRGNSGFGPDLFINNFIIENAPSCPKLIGLGTKGVTDSSAIMDWNSSAAAGSYQVWFGPQGFYQGTATVGGTKVFTTADSLFVDTLMDNTCYEFVVRQVCTPGDTSEWEGPVTFCTPCSPYTAPYLENFDALSSGLAGDLGNCWVGTGSTSTYSWRTNSGSTGSGSTGPNGDATTGSGIYIYTEASSGTSGDPATMTSPLVDISSLSNPELKFAYHMYGSNIDTLYIDIFDGAQWNMGVIHLDEQQQTSSADPWKDTIIDLTPYSSSGIVRARFRMKSRGCCTGDAAIDDVKFWDPPTADVSLIGAEFKKVSKCLSANDTIVIQAQNIVGSTINFSNTPLVAHYAVTGPVNTSGSFTVNSGTLPLGDTVTMVVAPINLSIPGNYSLDVYLDTSSINQDVLNDSLMSPANTTIYDDWDVQPDTVVVITNTTDTVILEASSPFLNGGSFFITEQCHFRTTTGAPTAGWPTYLIADDYIEITGVPGSDLGGYTLEQWTTSSMVTSRTFPQGTVLGPNGTAIIMIGSGASADDATNYMYNGVGSGSYSWGSSGPGGRVLKDANGVIVDAVAYSGGSSFTFPAAANVTAADWSGTPPTSTSTSGIRLEGPDVNSATGWVASATSPQDPNTLNANVPIPSAAATPGFGWTLNGNMVDTLPKTVVGPYNNSGVYNYIATLNGPCGIYTDTVVVIVNLPGSCPIPTNLAGTAPACDSIVVSWNNAQDSALVAYVAAGGTHGAGSLVVGDSSYAVVGVTPSTSYDFYVANICNGDTGMYAGPYTINSGTAGAPVANFTGQSANWNLTVDFDASTSTGDRATYAWDFGDGNTGSGQITQHTYAAAGTYAVKLTVTNACGVDDTTITMADVSIGENILSQGLKLYPNPAQDVLNIELDLEGKDEVSVRIMDMSGKQIMSASHTKADKQLKASMDLSDLAKGVYMIEVSNGKYTAVRRLVKE